jgi:FG-GAP repeat
VTAVLFSHPSRSQLPSTIDLAVDNAALEIHGAGSFDYTGSSLTVGDMNGDGVLDLVVAACDAIGLTGSRSGIFYVVWGVGGLVPGTLDLLTAPPGTVSRIFAPPNADYLHCKTLAGNFNSDEFDDIVIGEPAMPPATWSGRAYVILGSAQFPDTIDLGTASPGIVWIEGHRTQGLLGMGLCACDLDGDGYNEIVIGAPGIPNAEIYVIEGGTEFQDVYSTATIQPGMTRIIDPELFRATGTSIACADVDSDGRGDLLLGAPGNNLATTYDGRATLLYGVSSLPDTIALDQAGLRTKVILPEYSHGQLGNYVALGDVNGGGEIDAVISAYQGDPLGCENCGEVYVLYELDLMPQSVSLGDPNVSLARIIGDPMRHWFGIGIALGDIDHDGRDEVVAADLPSTGDQRSAIYVPDGQPMLPDSVFVATHPFVTTIWERYSGSHMGRAIACRDIDEDGVDDMIIGARRADPNGITDAGSVYLILGATATHITNPVPMSWVGNGVPNPFSSSVGVDYGLESSADVRMTIYDVAGRRILESFFPKQGIGSHRLVWGGIDGHGQLVPSGVYFCRLTAGGVTQTRKLVLLR